MVDEVEGSAESGSEAGETSTAETKDILYPEGGKGEEDTKAEGDSEGESSGEKDTKSDEDGGGSEEDSGKEEDAKSDGDESAKELTAEDLEFPEGTADEAKVGEYVDLINSFKDKSPKEIAQELIGFQESLYADQREAMADQADAWIDEVKADKKLGGDKFEETLSVVKQTTQNVPEGKEMAALLETYGLATHPTAVRFFYNIGKVISQDSFVQGSGAAAKADKTPQGILYPGSV